MEIQKSTTSITELAAFSKGAIVDLPPFGEGMPFVAKLRRPSMLSLVKQKKIPNSLLGTAGKLFGEGGVDLTNDKAMNDVYEVLDVVCEASFVEPTWQELKEAEVELTDEQYSFVFSYSQTGVKAIESFRQQQEGT